MRQIFNTYRINKFNGAIARFFTLFTLPLVHHIPPYCPQFALLLGITGCCLVTHPSQLSLVVRPQRPPHELSVHQCFQPQVDRDKIQLVLAQLSSPHPPRSPSSVMTLSATSRARSMDRLILARALNFRRVDYRLRSTGIIYHF